MNINKNLLVRVPSLLVSHLHSLLLPPRRRAKHRLDRLEAAQVQPTAQEYHREIENNVCPRYTIISPFGRVVDVEASRKFIAIGILAEFA